MRQSTCTHSRAWVSQLRSKTLVASLLAIAIACPSGAFPDGKDSGKRSTEASIRRLIDQLGADSWTTRESAQRQLSQEQAALPQLRQALRSSNPEIRKRSGQIVPVLLQKEYLRQIHEEGVDLFVERFVFMTDPLDVECGWQAMLDLAAQLLDREKTQLRKIPQRRINNLPLGNFHQLTSKKSYVSICKPTSEVVVKVPDPNLIRCRLLSSHAGIGNGLFAVTDEIQSGIMNAIVLSAGSIAADPMNINSSVVICDGTITGMAINDSVVIARGAITLKLDVGNSLVVCSGEFEMHPRLPARNSTIKSGQPDFLGWVKFFEPSQVGIDIVASNGVVKSAKLAKGMPFALAGVAPGDVIVALDGTVSKSSDEFRRLLRKKVARGGETIVRIRRDGKESNVKVLFAR